MRRGSWLQCLHPGGRLKRPSFFQFPGAGSFVRTAVMIPEPSSAAGEGLPPPEWRLEFERFSQQLIGMARKHLGARLENKVDPEDVVQSAYKSLLLRYGDGAIAKEGWDGLWGLLTTITVRKCADRARYHQAE